LWQPEAAEPSFGILYVILTSIIGTALAVLLGMPIGVLTAVFLAEVAPERLANIVRPAVELLAGIPSVIYGLLGILILNPLMYKLELWVFKGSETHQFTGGANLISAVLVLALMILPTVINISESSDNFPGGNSGGKIRYYYGHCPGNRTGYWRSDGDQPGIRKFCKRSPSV